MPVYVLAALASMPKENANNKKGRVVPACLPLDWVNITAADPKVRQKYLVDNSWHGAQRSKVPNHHRALCSRIDFHTYTYSMTMTHTHTIQICMPMCYTTRIRIF